MPAIVVCGERLSRSACRLPTTIGAPARGAERVCAPPGRHYSSCCCSRSGSCGDGGRSKRDHPSGETRAGRTWPTARPLRRPVHDVPRRTGDGVGGVDLRSGRFRNAVTNQDTRTRVITNGVAGTGCSPSNSIRRNSPASSRSSRSMNAVDRGSLKPGDAGRGRALFEGKGECAPATA